MTPVDRVTTPDDWLRTADRHATGNVPVASPRDEIAQVVAALPGRRFDSASVVAVVDDARLVGVVTIERLLAAPLTASVADVMDADPPTVAPHTNQEHAAWRAVQHGGAGSGRRRRRLTQRLPWLVVGFAGALVSALVVGMFDDQLEREVLIAFFVPGVVYLADAVGVQTTALVVRGLSIGVEIRRIVVRELLTGVIIGVLLAVIALPTVLVLWGSPEVAWAVALALFAASSFATLIAMTLPAVIHRLGKDPAYGAGPLSTVIQDLLSLVVYFLVASVIVF